MIGDCRLVVVGDDGIGFTILSLVMAMELGCFDPSDKPISRVDLTGKTAWDEPSPLPVAAADCWRGNKKSVGKNLYCIPAIETLERYFGVI